MRSVACLLLAGALVSVGSAQVYRVGWLSSTSIGLPDTNNARANAVDAAGNLYVLGEASFEKTPGTTEADLLLRKFSPTGALLWTRTYDHYAPDSRPERAWALALDRLGNVYVAGSVAPPAESGDDFLVVKYNPAGVLHWGRVWGPTTDRSEPRAVAVMGDGSVVVAGFRNQSSFEPQAAAVRFSPTGVRVWERSWLPAGARGAEINGLVVLPSNDLALVGRIVNAADNNPDAWVARLAGATGAQTWMQRVANSSRPTVTDVGTAITTDAAGNVYIGGTLWSTSGVFAAKFSPTGVRAWVREHPGSGFNCDVSGIAVDRVSGDVIFGGSLRNDPGGFTQDLFVARYSGAGLLRFLRFVPRPAPTFSDLATGFAYEAQGNAYIAGTSYANGGNGAGQFMVGKVGPTGTVLFTHVQPLFAGSTSDVARGFAADRLSGNLFVSGGRLGNETKRLRVVALYQRPIAVADRYTMARNTTLTVPDLGIFTNDSYWRGATFTRVNPTVGTLLAVRSTGGFTYRPPTNFTGTVTWRYTLSRPGLAPASTATVTITVR